MISLFRKNRQTEMQKGTLGKYLKYAVGEILLIVVGILVALQINNWNENKKNERSEKVFIAGVKEDLVQDREFINLVIEMAENKMEAFEQLIKLEDNREGDPEIQKIDSLLKIYLFVGQRTFYPITGSYHSALSTNEINSFRSKEEISAIVKLYTATYVRLLDNAVQLDNRWAHISKTYSHGRRTGSWKPVIPTELPTMIDELFHHYVQLKWYTNILKETLTEIDNLTDQ